MSKRKDEGNTGEAVTVLGDPPKGGDDRSYIAFVHAVLCQVGLPRKKLESTTFERTHKGASLLVEAGKLWNGSEWVQQPIPYGPKPRMMLADLFTYAVTHKTKVIPVEDSVTRYLARLGWTQQGGARGPLTAFRKQALALSACRLTLGISYGKHAHTIDGKPIKRFSAWLDDRGGQRTMWPGEIELTGDFYDSLVDHAVPLNGRALRELSGSALALDIYTWLAYRLHLLEKPSFLPWKPVREQFGQEYADPKNFKREFISAFKQVVAVYPEAAKSSEVTGGLLLHPAPPPIRSTKLWFRRPSFSPTSPAAAASSPQTEAWHDLMASLRPPPPEKP